MATHMAQVGIDPDQMRDWMRVRNAASRDGGVRERRRTSVSEHYGAKVTINRDFLSESW